MFENVIQNIAGCYLLSPCSFPVRLKSFSIQKPQVINAHNNSKLYMLQQCFAVKVIEQNVYT